MKNENGQTDPISAVVDGEHRPIVDSNAAPAPEHGVTYLNKEPVRVVVDSTSDQRVVNNVMRHNYRVLSDATAARSNARPTESLSAYELVLRARAILYQYQPGDLDENEAILARAIALDSKYAAAHAMLAATSMLCRYTMAIGRGASGDSRQLGERSF